MLTNLFWLSDISRLQFRYLKPHLFSSQQYPISQQEEEVDFTLSGAEVCSHYGNS